MAYIGRSVDIGMFEKQVLTADSSTTTFTLTFAVGSANSLLVVYGGVIQEPAVAYSVSGGGQQIVFSEAPATGTTTYIIYLGKQLSTPRAAGQETTKQTFTGNGSTVTYTLTDPPVVPAGIMVFVDGILQREGSGNNYVSSGSTITFSTAPDSGAEIDVYTLVKEKVSIDTVADGSITFAKLVAGSPTWNGAGETVIETASTGNSLRITNTGSGNSLLVEDSSNPDATPVVIDNAGNTFIGYGTSVAPSAVSGCEFQVNSSGTTQASILATQWGVNSTGSAQILLAHSLSGVRGTQSIVSSGAALGKIKFFGSDGTNFIEAASIESYADGTPGTNDMPGKLVFSTTADGASTPTERMRITSAGNVGIGTTTPSLPLDAQGVLSAGALVSVAHFGQNSGSSPTIGQGARITLSANNSKSRAVAIDGIHESSTNAHAMVFSTSANGAAPAERMRIDSAGNVGIGIAVPTSKLHVSGGRTDLTANSETYALGVRYGSSTGIYYIGATNSATPDLVFSQTGGSERMRLTNDGKLGIGVTPAAGTDAKLQITGGTTNATTLATAYSLASVVVVPKSTSGYSLAFASGTGDFPQLQVSANGAASGDLLIQPYGGNLLVGTTDSTKGALMVGKAAPSSAYGQICAFSPTAADTDISGMSIVKYANNSTTAQVLFRFLINQGAAGQGQINGNGANAAAFGSYSDARLKENIVDLPSQLANIMALRPVEFDYIESEGGGHQIGFVAQEVKEIYPDLVGEDADGMYTLSDMNKNDARLIKAIQELKAIVDAQAVEIAALKVK